MKSIFNKINNFYIALILLLIIIITHIDIIIAPVGQYFSGLDLIDLNYYINIRQYGFDKLLSETFPLWTTKIFSGIPFFANSETAIFYLPNIIFLFLPISKAINFSFLIHFFIFSFGIFLWINNKIKDKGNYKLNILYFDENSIEFECKTTKPAIILYTDNYSRGWQAYNIDNSKEKYEIICADYIYKAISINEGTHKIRMEYKPLSFIIGMYISTTSWIMFFILFIFFHIKRKYSIKIK